MKSEWLRAASRHREESYFSKSFPFILFNLRTTFSINVNWPYVIYRLSRVVVERQLHSLARLIINHEYSSTLSILA